VQARAVDARTRGNWDSLRRADEARTRRLAAVGAELDDWKLREADAQGRLLDLTARRDDVQREHAARLGDPERLAARREEATASVHAAEAAARRAADRLAHAERTTADTERALRAAESALAEARETRVRREGEGARADAAWGVVAERLLERLGVDPVLPDPPPVLDEAAEEKPRRRLERLVREREGMGPVNMRAEIEAAEVETRVATVLHEVEELTAAIAKLRGSIGHINREGRERLGQVFADIDRHFRALFEAMFGGGRAHLALVGSEDPLQAGLEIYAQPPGKKLATLSLLSGGEQALTALSLVFAVFRCNPAPVCVLDEVDAPLDDANVERFCGLLEAMVRETGTRFLVVTHHQLTMARMNRLYGVTMQERGVSRLLSVDLSRATELAETPRMAAE
jgi:chromosome segregation protein